MEHSIKIQALAKTFPSGGLKQLSFELGLGVTAIIGPNGAGKSTLLRCLSTYFEPDGAVSVTEPWISTALKRNIAIASVICPKSFAYRGT